MSIAIYFAIFLTLHRRNDSITNAEKQNGMKRLQFVFFFFQKNLQSHIIYKISAAKQRDKICTLLLMFLFIPKDLCIMLFIMLLKSPSKNDCAA